MNKLEKSRSIINILIVILVSFTFLGCSKDEVIEDQYKIENFQIKQGENPFQVLLVNGYKNILDFQEIIGERLLEKAMEDSVYISVRATKDSLEILDLSFDAYNAKYKIVSADSTKFSVLVEKPIMKGGSIYQVLTDVGMPAKSVGYYAWKLGEYIDATSIDVGDIMTIDFSVDSLNVKKFEKFSYRPDKTSIHEFYILGPRELEYNKITLPYELRRRVVKGILTKNNSTLDAALDSLGVIPYIRQQVNNAMQSQIAFSTDARVGDMFEVYIEEKFVDGEMQPRGKVLYAKYSGRRAGTKYAYRYEDSAESSAFSGMYTKKGKRLVSNAVRTPLDIMHISSPFGYRIHPISGRRKLHTGIDLRGRTGTPVYAVSSGIVIKAYNNGNGFGKAIRIRHDNGMITQYAHLNSIKTRKGRRVRKGQLIGTVGNTGYSTGPHLHFGVMKNGKWVNPKTNLRMVGANQLKGDKLRKFQEQISSYTNEISMIAESDSLIVKEFR